MCGLCGLLYFDSQRTVSPHLLQAMTDVITHRGPDDAGHFIDGPIGLGSRRLSILGLGDGHMPMSSEDTRIWVAYNGELYNHPQIKDKLTAKGYTYRTGSDTESFIHLYREYGDSFLEHTQGMFGLALWDATKRKLILARDRVGIKPLYYYSDRTGIRFGSEIKSILCDADVPREIDPNALNDYLAYLATSAPRSMFKGIRKLHPGEMLICHDGKYSVQAYWQPSQSIQMNPQATAEHSPKELAERLKQSVKEHLLADVPVGSFLSGGIDSSILTALMHEEIGPHFKTFSIGFKDHSLFDETSHAAIIAKQYQTDHHVQMLSSSDLLSALDDITWQFDEPLADSSSLPLYFVSKLAAEHVKVVLSGDGADEVFAGYRKYQGEHFRRYVSWLPDSLLRGLSHTIERTFPESRSGYWMDLLRQVKKFFRGVDPDPFERHLKWAIHFEDSIRKSLIHPDRLSEIDFTAPYQFRRKLFDELPQLDDLNRMLWVDLKHGLSADMLVKVDRMSMLHSLEVRVPFLDHKLIEYGFSLPSSLKLRGNTTKWILKQAFADRLPDSILNRRKHGFDIPIGEWFRHELRELIEDVCSEKTISNRGLFNPKQVQQLLADHLSGTRDYNNQLWMLLSLEFWQRQYLDTRPGIVPARPV